MSQFDHLGLSPKLLKFIQVTEWKTPTPIQSQAIPIVLQGEDLIAQAQTGTGKTAAFALPLLDLMNWDSRLGVQLLILAPTRELAAQVAQTFKRFIEPEHHEQVCLIYGGQAIGPQFDQLKQNPKLIIATPGRLIDHINRGTLELNTVQSVVLDEADEMLNLGFRDEVEFILSNAANRKQTLLFSATMPKEIKEISERFLKPKFQFIRIQGEGRTSDLIDEGYVLLKSRDRFALLCHFLELEHEGITLIFTRTRKETTELADQLLATGYQAEALSGELTQNLREAVVKRLKEKRLSVVVATDVAARGLDIDGITLVINYDVPFDLESYVHRVGRTGRAGQSGRAILLVTPREIRSFEKLQDFLKRPLHPIDTPAKEKLIESRKNKLIRQIRQINQQISTNDELYLEKTLTRYQTVMTLLEEELGSSRDLALVALILASQNHLLSESALPPLVQSLDLDEVKAKQYPTIKANEGCSIIVLNIGKLKGVRPKDIVGAIAHEAKINGSKVGAIRIEFTRTLFELPNEYIDLLFERLSGKPICGHFAQFELWNGQVEAYVPTAQDLKYSHQLKRSTKHSNRYENRDQNDKRYDEAQVYRIQKSFG